LIIGIPKEIKSNEYRCAVTPESVSQLRSNGHTVLIETKAGLGSSISDDDFRQAGAQIMTTEEVYNNAEMIYKVKEILPIEYPFMRENLILFTYIHSNAHSEMTDVLLSSKSIGIAYEDITDNIGNFPLLRPMSEIAGKGGFLAASQFLQSIHNGRGILLARVSGVETPDVTIIGAGNAGFGVAEMAAGLGNKVSILDISVEKLEAIKHRLPPNVELLISSKENIEKCLKRSDVLFNCILWPKWRKDHLVTREMLSLMKPGALIADIACDEAGAIETCRATSHDKPVYFEEDIMHYCVDNIPAAFARTSTYLLSSTTLPYAMEIANKGVVRALKENKNLRNGLTCFKGLLTLEETALKQNRQYTKADEIAEIIN
jgi:alanine dehydrogenase